jgi:anti-sigma regulatory factor (Ser/Thr protein kinase)
MTEQVVWASRVQLRPETGSPARARDFVGHQLAEHGLSYLIDDVRLVVSELVTNAVVHARTPIEVSVAELLFCVRLMVFDESAELPVSPPAGWSGEDAEGGRGLWVTEACSSDWGTDPAGGDGKSVWALFPVRPA